jgi:acyl transferase domain-containing protein/acyl carrier protein
MTRTERIDYAALLRDAYCTIERLEADVRRLERATNEPVAIVGIGCRVPGARSVDAYWELLRDGVDAVEEVPASRWNVAEHYDANPDVAGKMSTRWGGFLPDVDHFDAAFFGISPREANGMDPQQRLLLEVAWEALENAGIAPDSLMGSQTGVFVGISTGDYVQLQTRQGDATIYDAYLATGNSHSVASGRLAYTLGLHGPTVSVDTACSSSLIAVHLACRALRDGSCPTALACGVNLILAPETTATLSKAQMMSPTGRCRTFSAAADGFVRSEGCGVVVLKRLSDAFASGDRVLAVIRGSAINQDGRSNGLTAPNGLAQAAVIRAALVDAGVDASEVSYVEAHGTGTPLGDPIEVQALAEALCSGRPAGNRLLVGSVKTNIGHLEAAAGVAGLIKVVLALQHREVPGNLHVGDRNPHINWAAYPIDVPTRLTPWRTGDQLPVGGVSSFGFSGSNAHVVVQAAPPPPDAESRPEVVSRPVHVLALSAKSHVSLQRLVADYAACLQGHPGVDFGDVCFTANTGRSHMTHRFAVTAARSEEAHDQLARAIRAGVPSGCEVRRERDSLGFLFTGQGSQYPSMGSRLYKSQPTFRAAIDRCDALLQSVAGVSLHKMLFADDAAKLDQTAQTQPALFAFEYALAELWRSWGVRPSFVLGHSVGELVAACVAGVFQLEDGLRLVSARGRLMQELPAGGQMAAISAGVEEVHSLLRECEGAVSIAAINGPENTVISGRGQDLEKVLEACRRQSIRCRSLRVSHAFHSALLDPMLDAFEQVAAGVSYAQPRIQVISNLTGGPVDEEMCHPGYWRAHARQAVRFADGVRALYEHGCRVFLEIGPSPVLTGMAKQVVTAEDACWIPTLKQGRDDWQQTADAAVALYMAGQEIDWRAFDAPYGRQRIALPTYPFERQRHWFKAAAGSAARLSERGAGEPGHALLGRRIVSPLSELQFESTISSTKPAYLAGHVVFGRTIMPASVCVEAALAAGRELAPERQAALEDVSYPEPIVFAEGEVCRLHTVLKRDEDDVVTFRVFGAAAGEGETVPVSWRILATGRLCWYDETLGREGETRNTLEGARRRCDRPVDVGEYYRSLAEAGGEYAGAFRALEVLSTAEHEAIGLARLAPAESHDAAAYLVHPVLLDACTQVLGAAVSGFGAADAAHDTYLPFGFERFQLWKPGLSSMWSRVAVRPRAGLEGRSLVADIDLWTEAGEPAGRVDGVVLERVEASALRDSSDRRAVREWLYHERWESAPSAATAAHEIRNWVIVGSGESLGARLAERLRADGDDVVTATPPRPAAPVAAEQPTDSGDAFERSIAQAVALPSPSGWGIVYLARMGEAAAGDEGRRAASACFAPLRVVQAAARATGSVRVWFVTDRAQPVNGEDGPGGLEQAPILGFARSAGLEYPFLGCDRIDIDGEGDVDCIAHLVQALREHGDGEDEVAWRADGRLVRRLARVAPVGPSVAPLCSADATYLVTGAFGGLGPIIARWLVSRGARYLLLVSRQDHPDVSVPLLEDIRRQGVRVRVDRCDLGDPAQVAQMLEGARGEFPPLRGIVHAAGATEDGLLADLPWPSFERVGSPKIRGAWNLHDLTAGQSLDFFVLFSSAASLVGSAGQANYAAANAFLDALARRRRNAGLAGVSINWGPWGDVGMATSVAHAHRRRWVDHGVNFIGESRGLEALGVILSRSEAQILVLPIDWRRAGSVTARPLFAAVRPATPAEDRASTSGHQPLVRKALLALGGQARREAATEYVRGVAASALGLPASELDPRRPLTDLGFDSLMALELKNGIAKDLDVTISLARFVDGASVEDCAALLCSSLDGASARAIGAEASPREEYSDAEVEAMLNGLLETDGEQQP